MRIFNVASSPGGGGSGGGGGGSGPSSIPPGQLEFQLVYRKPNGKNDNMRFSSEWRSDIVTRIRHAVDIR